MYFRKIFTLLALTIATLSFSQEEQKEEQKVKLYGFVRNDFYYNSRLNCDAMDGTFNIFPKAISYDAKGNDINAIPQAEMLSIYSRLGLEYNGTTLFGAKSSGKIEADFAGISATYYLVRIMHAYGKLNWSNSELLIGQTWHPLAGSLMPSLQSVNQETPFQPFNRSPQIKFKQNIGSSFSISAAGIYQMQYTSLGPSGSTSAYMKNAITPDLFVGAEFKTSTFTAGLGGEMKTIKPDALVSPYYSNSLISKSALLYAQFSIPNFVIKAKAIYGQNLSDQCMIGGYGIKGVDANGVAQYTNFNTATAWINAVYGTKFQMGFFAGISKNMGTQDDLLAVGGKYVVYGFGSDPVNQLNQLYRIKPYVAFNLSNFRVELQLDRTTADYGKLNAKGLVDTHSAVSNNRVVASISYLF